MIHFVFNELHAYLTFLSFIITGTRLIDQDSFVCFNDLGSQLVYDYLLVSDLVDLHILCQVVFTMDENYHQVTS
jgi:hypothetical protein